MTGSICSPSPDGLLKELTAKMMNIGLLLVSRFSIQRAKPRNFLVRLFLKKKIFLGDVFFFTKEKYGVRKKIVKKQVGIVKVL